MTEHHHEPYHGDRHFFYSTHRLEAPRERLTAQQLKAYIAEHVAGFNLEHTLVLEEEGDRPDKPLADGDEVHIHGFPHFYDQPPANFGS
jgi:hypothetical protein